MTITQLIQSSPANANELFAKLAATTHGAVKTRESLFSELRAELELHSRMEEEHLFPVIRKHKETKDLVRNAVADNKRARALLEELEAMPKEGEEFLAKVEELRKVFQQHVRDEKKELLPAVRTALSNEEAQAITAKVEADKAAREETKRVEAEERRAAARQAREKAERLRAQREARRQRAQEEEKRQQAELRAEQRRARQEEKQRQEEAEAEQRRVKEAGAALARTGESLVTGTQSIAVAAAAAAQAGADSAVENTRQIAGAVSDAAGDTIVGFARAAENQSGAARPVMETLQAFTGLPQATARAAADTGATLFEYMSSSSERRARSSLSLMQCVTPGQVAQVQARYLGEAVGGWLDVNVRMLDATLRAYRTMLPQTPSTAEQGEAGRKTA